MARTFTATSSHKITLSLGSLGFVFGPGSVAALVYSTNIAASNRTVISSGATNAVSWMLQVLTATGQVALRLDGTEVHSTTTISINKWYLLGASKGTGTVTPTLHIYDYATNAWVHEAASGTRVNSSTPLTQAQIGCTPAVAAFWDGDIAVAGSWDVVLSDAQFEALAYGLRAWFAVQPRGLFVLDQASTAQQLEDMSGGGANQSAITGTAVSARSVPIWSRGVPVLASL